MFPPVYNQVEGERAREAESEKQRRCGAGSERRHNKRGLDKPAYVLKERREARDSQSPKSWAGGGGGGVGCV